MQTLYKFISQQSIKWGEIGSNEQSIQVRACKSEEK